MQNSAKQRRVSIEELDNEEVRNVIRSFRTLGTTKAKHCTHSLSWRPARPDKALANVIAATLGPLSPRLMVTVRFKLDPVNIGVVKFP